MRVIFGSAKGRNLVSPKSKNVRPTTDRVKQFIFDCLGD
ncbi:MAG: 16S rRNA (guanine(966)-N(2))-methyltransferase RsmD, partial [Calditrichaeota bacterium]